MLLLPSGSGSSACTYCGEPVGNDAKITIEHLNIDAHPHCFKVIQGGPKTGFCAIYNLTFSGQQFGVRIHMCPSRHKSLFESRGKKVN